MKNENLENTVYELIRINAQTKLLAQKREYLLAELEKTEKELIQIDRDFDAVIVENQ